MSGGRKVRVLVVDDSAIVRKLVSEALNADPGVEVVGTAVDPYIARDKILALDPDVLTLDIEMPRMDGITFLKILMKHHPLPVIVMSSLSQAGSKHALDALEAGAVDVLAKPGGAYSVGDLAEELVRKVKAVAFSRRAAPPGADASLAVTRGGPVDSRQIILLGASTGGTEALKEIIPRLPEEMPGICIVQHIPAYFSGPFAERLNTLSALEVREARDGDRVRPGLALVAPGDFHMLLQADGTGCRVRLKQGPKVWYQRPAVDVLFESAATVVGDRAVAGVLTGMGSDGAAGLLRLRQAGSRTFAQSESTCVVFGMPRVAMEVGAAERVLDLCDVPGFLVDGVSPPLAAG